MWQDTRSFLDSLSFVARSPQDLDSKYPRLRPTLHKPSTHLRQLSMDGRLLPQLLPTPSKQQGLRPLGSGSRLSTSLSHRVKLSPVTVSRKFPRRHRVHESLLVSIPVSYNSSPRRKYGDHRSALLPAFTLNEKSEVFGVTFGKAAL